MQFVDAWSLQAKHIIALNWKNGDDPRIGKWIKEMASNMIMEKIKHIIKQKKHIFNDVWKPVISFLRGDVNVSNFNRMNLSESKNCLPK